MPAPQTAQLDDVDADDADDAVPAGQLMQLDCPELVWYVPAAQDWHTEAPGPEYLPAKHTAQLDSVVADDADNVVPAGQLKQLDCPELVWYVPAAQG